MKLINLLLIMSCALIASGCAPKYQPAGKLGNGYSETRIDNNKMLVSYKSSTQISDDKAKSYLLRRCAELTQQAGYDYFIVDSVSSKTVQNTNMLPGANPGQTVVVTDPSGTTKTTNANVYTASQSYSTIKYQANATITMYKGTKPANNKKAFSVKDVLNHTLSTSNSSSVL